MTDKTKVLMIKSDNTPTGLLEALNTKLAQGSYEVTPVDIEKAVDTQLDWNKNYAGKYIYINLSTPQAQIGGLGCQKINAEKDAEAIFKAVENIKNAQQSQPAPTTNSITTVGVNDTPDRQVTR